MMGNNQQRKIASLERKIAEFDAKAVKYAGSEIPRQKAAMTLSSNKAKQYRRELADYVAKITKQGGDSDER